VLAAPYGQIAGFDAAVLAGYRMRPSSSR